MPYKEHRFNLFMYILLFFEDIKAGNLCIGQVGVSLKEDLKKAETQNHLYHSEPRNKTSHRQREIIKYLWKENSYDEKKVL